MDVALVMVGPDGTRRSFPVSKSVTTIGRAHDCDFRVPLASVSRRHCRLVTDGQYVRLEDVGSANGTLVNGQSVELAVLSAGDTVSVGPVNFLLKIDGVPADPSAVPPSVAGRPGGAASGEKAPTSSPSKVTSDDEIDRILSSTDAGDSVPGDVLIDLGLDDERK